MRALARLHRPRIIFLCLAMNRSNEVRHIGANEATNSAIGKWTSIGWRDFFTIRASTRIGTQSIVDSRGRDRGVSDSDTHLIHSFDHVARRKQTGHRCFLVSVYNEFAVAALCSQPRC